MIKVVPISGRTHLKKFVRFKIKLYKGNKYAVPALVLDELATLNPKVNPAFEFCESQCFLAYQGRKIVGRICAIINHRANQTWGKKAARFGFFDFVDDIQVARALLGAAENWALERSMEALHGPLGFTDMDEEGMLVQGFDELGTMATLYNFPYYGQFMEQLGYQKDVDWVEFKIDVPYPTISDRILKISDIVANKCNLHLVSCKNAGQLVSEGWGNKIFDLINIAYAPLYGFSGLTDRQIDHYVKLYFPIVRMDLIAMIADKEDNLVGFGISIPSLSKALQKAKGRMLPFGWIYMLIALKRRKVDVADLLLTAVHPDYQNKGVPAMVMKSIIGGMQKMGVKYSESNPELELNEKMRGQWDEFSRQQHKRRRAYIKQLTK